MKYSDKFDTFHPYPRDRTIHSFFEKAAEKYPDRTAVEFGDAHISYGALNETADRLAAVLIESGISCGDVVAVAAQRSIDMVIAVIGILKSGAAYLPIDLNIPDERKRYYIEASNTKTILSEKSNEVLFGVPNINIHKIPQPKSQSHTVIQTSNALAYIIFTSGSTGLPKGVMVQHRSVVNRLLWMQDQYKLCEKDVFIQKTPVSFDVSVWELFLWFFCGAKLCLLKSGYEGNAAYLLEVIHAHKVTVCHFVPSMLRVFLDYLSHRGGTERLTSITKVFSSGETLKYDTVALFNQLLTRTNAIQLHNLYGPTEATIDVTFFDCTNYQSEKGIVPIGKPIWNTNIYILDENGCKCSDGEKGEIYISGEGVALGYVNNMELTRKMFLPDPFRPGAVMYKTGDMGEWNEGNIEFLGRMDNQVQIHGIRIEPEEIENQLSCHESIEQAVVVAVGDDDKKLIAYYTGVKIADISVLSGYLSDRLPKTMIPVDYIFLESIPLNAHGKIDRKKLEDLYKDKPVTAKQCGKVLDVVTQVVGRQIRMNDDFSQSDIDSITFIRIIVTLESEFNFEFDEEKLLITEFPKVSSLIEYVESKLQ